MEGRQDVVSSSLQKASIAVDDEAGEVSAANGSDYHGNNMCEDVSWLDDSADEVDGASSLDREWKNRREQFYNAGYRDGISAGKIDAAQDGFNHGFKDSVMTGYKWGIVRGITSALANLPDELKMKLVEKDEVRGEFLNLHGAVKSISTGDALKLFAEDTQREKIVKQRSGIEPGSSATHQSSSEHSALDNHFGKLKLLLKESPVVDLNSGSIQNRIS